ncbi:translation initiation factor IF-2 [bacterium]|nr:translation initiation factor IF-2 [bacterium]|tara:strand:- start:3884 stop:5422 length:1539 start_codon:yes stop_codon:yes gene_type:complete
MPVTTTQKNIHEMERPPVVVVLGHIDHGKSTLLDYIRKTNTTEKEAGGITQHISAYEVEYKTKDGAEKRITFLDTPGHTAFTKMRERGAHLADVAIVVVSAEDGVKQQTLEVLTMLKEDKIPYIVAINKIDRPNANVEKIKQELAEHEVLVEGYGGDIPVVSISAKTGVGIDELLEMMLLVAELQELKGNTNLPAEGVVVESHIDPREGISATLIIKNGTLKREMYVAADTALAPVRRIDTFLNHNAEEATFSSPVLLTGFNATPQVGVLFKSFKTKKEAGVYIKEQSQIKTTPQSSTQQQGDEPENSEVSEHVVPIVIKADTTGSLEALEHEIKKLEGEMKTFKIIHRGVGNIEEGDLKIASSGKHTIITGFNVSVGKPAEKAALQHGLAIKTFSIIYELIEWLSEEIKKRTPKITVEEETGTAKIMKTFSKAKGKQVVGGKVLTGELTVPGKIKIMRRGNEIDKGEIVELQQQKAKTKSVKDGFEFGAMIESKHDIATGDTIEAFQLVEK